MKSDKIEATMYTVTPQASRSILPLKELWQSRDLLLLLTLKEIKIRYKEAWIGILWALIQPLLTLSLFLFFLNRTKGEESVSTLFALGGIVPWIYISNQLILASSSLTVDSDLIKKVSFPRLLLPLSKLTAGIVDLSVALFLFVLFSGFHLSLLLLPFWVLFLLFTMIGPAAFIAAAGALYRDVRYLLSFTIQLGLFLLPILYSIDTLPPSLQPLFELNPFVAPIELLRWIVLGLDTPLTLLLLSTLSSLACTLLSLAYFRKTETLLPDLL